MGIKILKYSLILPFLLFITSFAHADGKQVLDLLLRNTTDPMMGNPHGNITIVEFFDYQCSHCASMAKTLTSVAKSHSNIKIVFKDYPIRGKASYLAATAALAANKQGKYKELYNALLSTEQELTESLILTLAKQHGLDINKLKKDMQSKSIANQIAETKELGSFLGIPGTPILFIGKSNATNPKEVVFIPGEVSVKEMNEMIQKVENS